MKKSLLFLLIASCFIFKAGAQDDLLGDLVKEDAKIVKQNFTTSTFKSVRIINMHSVEMTGKGNLQFMISHRFPNLWNSDGSVWKNFAQLFGFNSGTAATYMSFDYSPKDWINFGLAATGNANFEGWTKIRLMRQQSGKYNYPVTLSLLSLANVDATDGPSPEDFTWNRFAFQNQFLIARKFSEKFSLQLMPTMIHYNYVPYGFNNVNTIFSIGLGGRYKLSDKTALTFEYSRQLNGYQNLLDESAAAVNYVPDLISLGYDWDTGGHIFQFFLSNTTSAVNIRQLSANTNDFGKGHISLGFNLNRSYGIKKLVKTN